MLTETVSKCIYDAAGKRMRRETGGVATWLVYGLDGELVAEYAMRVMLLLVRITQTTNRHLPQRMFCWALLGEADRKFNSYEKSMTQATAFSAFSF